MLASLWSCKHSSPAEKSKEDPRQDTSVQNDSRPDWIRNASIYQVNLQQYTKEGTFNAFKPHIPRLKDMGVQVVLLMPVFSKSGIVQSKPINFYNDVIDFRSVDESLGTLKDFANLVNQIHRSGMHVVLECPIQHTALKHSWKNNHPGFYKKDKERELKLDFSNQKLRKKILSDLNYWMDQQNLDGICLDNVNQFPVDFLEEIQTQICTDKNELLIFDSNINNQKNDQNFVEFDNSLFRNLSGIVNGKLNAIDLEKILISQNKNKLYCNFSSNDFYNRNGTEFNRFGDAHKAIAVLTGTLPGVPMIYSGQEEPSRKILSLGNEDKLNFRDYAYMDFYRSLLSLKKRNKAIWNGQYGGPLQRINTSADESVFAFTRIKDGDKVVVIVNLSNEPKTVSFKSSGHEGDYQNVFGNSTLSINSDTNLNLRAWDFLVLSNK